MKLQTCVPLSHFIQHVKVYRCSALQFYLTQSEIRKLNLISAQQIVGIVRRI